MAPRTSRGAIVFRRTSALAHEERVRAPLLADRRRRSVTRNERDVVAQRQDLRLDRADQRVVIAAREVRATDRALEEHVPHDRELRLALEEDDVTGRVARAVAHFEHDVAEL